VADGLNWFVRIFELQLLRWEHVVNSARVSHQQPLENASWCVGNSALGARLSNFSEIPKTEGMMIFHPGLITTHAAAAAARSILIFHELLYSTFLRHYTAFQDPLCGNQLICIKLCVSFFPREDVKQKKKERKAYIFRE
jgi:hypothetical protein